MLRADPSRRAAAAAVGLLLAVPALAADGTATAACPNPSDARRALAAVDRSASARVARFAEPLPADLFERATGEPGRGFTERDGRTVHGAMLAELPVALVWQAVSDEEHFDLNDERYMPLVRSEVVDRSDDGIRKTVFQTFSKFGISRWWLSEVTVSRELFATSGGAIWEVSWADVIDRSGQPDPRVRDAVGSMKPLRKTYGAWLLVPLGERCTYVDYIVHADPGGLVGAIQVMFASKAVRDTLEGVVRLAQEHVRAAHEPGDFAAPDGSPLGGPRAGGPPGGGS